MTEPLNPETVRKWLNKHRGNISNNGVEELEDILPKPSRLTLQDMYNDGIDPQDYQWSQCEVNDRFGDAVIINISDGFVNTMNEFGVVNIGLMGDVIPLLGPKLNPWVMLKSAELQNMLVKDQEDHIGQLGERIAELEATLADLRDSFTVHGPDYAQDGEHTSGTVPSGLSTRGGSRVEDFHANGADVRIQELLDGTVRITVAAGRAIHTFRTEGPVDIEQLESPDKVDRTGWEGKNGPFPDPVGPYADRFSPDIQEVVESWLQERDFGVTNLVKTTLEAISEAAALLNDEQGTGSQQEPKMGEAWLTEVSAGETIVALCGRVDPKDTELTWFTDDGAGWDMDYLTPLARLVPETDREMLAVEEELQLLRAENARLTRAVNFCEWNWSEAEGLIKENERMHREGKHD